MAPITNIKPNNLLFIGVFLTRYQKGSAAERELISLLYAKGFSVLRAAGSGKSSFPAPDIVALNREKKLAIECKAWDSDYLSIPLAQMEEQIGWSERAGAEMVVAWKMPREGFFFLSPNHFVKTAKSYAISKENAKKNGSKLDVFLGFQSRLKV